MPGWPIGFGDRDKAADFLQKALAAPPRPDADINTLVTKVRTELE